MFDKISQLAVHLAELGEAEGRVLREHLDRILLRVLLLLGAAFVGLAGLALVLVGVFRKLAEEMGGAWASMLLGLLMILLGGVLFSVASAYAGSLPSRRKP